MLHSIFNLLYKADQVLLNVSSLLFTQNPVRKSIPSIYLSNVLYNYFLQDLISYIIFIKYIFINHFLYRTKSRVNSIYPQNVTPQGPIKASLNVPAGCYPMMPLSDLHECTYNNPFYPQATGCYFSGSL